ncbi:MAG: sugar ABC transporter ATP-binding protein [Pirellulales bacterium]
MENISKRFGATQALSNVSLKAVAGEVLALIGENGAGKSTMMKILSGAILPDSGKMQLGDQEYAPTGPLDARAVGVAMIYQELTLAPDLSVEDNIMLGLEMHKYGGVLNRREQRKKIHEVLNRLGHSELQPTAIVGTLSVGAQQLVEIARALVIDARVIVFDEPTSSLTQKDVQHLFQVIKWLKESGRAVIYISHFLEEVREICDHYAVLRDGTMAGSGTLKDVTESEIVTLMVGRTVEELFPQIPHTPSDTILKVTGVSSRSKPHNVSFELRRGEILGFSGLVGSGRTELLRAIYGLDPHRVGVVELNGNKVERNPASAIRAGMGFVSEDRKTEGLAQERSINDNLTYSHLKPYSKYGFLNLGFRLKQAQHWMQKLQVKAQSATQEIGALSGGNQQKVAIARVLHQEADVLLLDEPTRGIDVGTKSEIYRLIGELAASNKAIIFVSSYLPELMAICDRIAVMNRGYLREIRDTNQWTEEEIMAEAIRSD